MTMVGVGLDIAKQVFTSARSGPDGQGDAAEPAAEGRGRELLCQSGPCLFG